MKRGLAIVLLAGCSMGEPTGGDDGPVGPDAQGSCDLFLTFTPTTANAGPTTEIWATANPVNAPGVLEYAWEVTKGGNPVPFTYRQLDHSSIAFIGADAGAYHVMVAISGGGFCPTAQGDVNVGVEGAGSSQVRLRVYPAPGTLAPPQEQLKLIPGGSAEHSFNTVAIDPGVTVTGYVRMDTTPVPSYVRFIPLGARDAYIEAFTGADGQFVTRTLNQLHDVLVVPMIPGYAPRLVTNWTPSTNVNVGPGTTISGTVLDPSGAPIAGAQVQLALDDVPSTLATTNSAGVFVVRAELPVGLPELRVEVTPPVASGWPRVSGSSMTLAATMPITIAYSAALTRRDVGGTIVRRGGVAQVNAPVKIVGTIGAVAAITSGSTTIPANGEVRIATQTTGSGALPPLFAPAVPLSAVSQIGAQLAVDGFDLTTGVPASIDAPAAVPIDITLRDDAGVALPAAVVELAPSGALRLAGASTLRVTANGAGSAAVAVPVGGVFDIRASDPQGRGAPVRLAAVPAASIAASYKLAKAKRVVGKLVLSGNVQPVGRATVQILCTLCAGVERSQPLAEGSTSSAGELALAVEDVGVMP